MLWESIVESYRKDPRDVCTIRGLWFYVFCKDGKLYISRAKDHTNSSRLSKIRSMDQNECDLMFSLYLRKKRGEPVSSEATATTYNQSYWYGIFKEMDLKK